MERFELVIRARRAIVGKEGGERQAAVAVTGGGIRDVFTGAGARALEVVGDHTIELGDDVLLLPGGVDVDAALEVSPGADDVERRTRAAARGGVTTLLAAPAAGRDLAAAREEARGNCVVDVGFWAGSADETGGGETDGGATGAAFGPVTDSVDDAIATARKTGAAVHVRAVTDPAVLPTLAAARAEGLGITASTTVGALTSRIGDGEREELWAALAEGTLDAVGSAGESPELLLPLLWTEGRLRGVSMADVVRWTSSSPAALLGLDDRGPLVPGARADLAVFADDEAFVDLPSGRALAGVLRYSVLAGVVLEPRSLPLGAVLTRPGARG